MNCLLLSNGFLDATHQEFVIFTAIVSLHDFSTSSPLISLFHTNNFCVNVIIADELHCRLARGVPGTGQRGSVVLQNAIWK